MSIDPADLLRQHGIQVTAQRLAVLRAVSGQPHITADGVAEVVRAEIGAISLQSVYDALGLLVAEGLIRRIQPAGSAGSLRGSRRRQPPPSDLSNLRPCGRRRLRGRLRPVSHGGRRHGLRDRRGRSRLLGPLSGLPGPGPGAIRSDPPAAGADAATDRTQTADIPSTDLKKNPLD